MSEYNLRASYDNRKEFYGKAVVVERDGVTTLRSYQTDVAYIREGKAVVRGTYSPTTLRHIKEFLKQHGFKADTLTQIVKDYPEPTEAEQEQEQADPFKAVNMAMAFGQIMGGTQAEKNRFDKRMLNTIDGANFPDDWDSLPEEEKTRRLAGAKEQLL